MTRPDGPTGAAPDPRALTRAHFDRVVRVTTRWSDNDMYGHLNNAVYYELAHPKVSELLVIARTFLIDTLAARRDQFDLANSLPPLGTAE